MSPRLSQLIILSSIAWRSNTSFLFTRSQLFTQLVTQPPYLSIDFFLLYSFKYVVTYLGLCLDLIYVHTNFILSITTIYMSIEMNAIIQFSISLNGIKGSHNLTFHLCIYFNKQPYLVRRFWCAKVPVASTTCLPCSCPSVCRPPQSHYHSPSLFSDDLYSCCGIFFVNAHPLLSLGPTFVIQQVIVFSVY